MNFTSQICTTCEQSERLIALGLKKETADMCWNKLTLHGTPVTYPSQDVWSDYSIISDSHYPAWSLHRLIEMMPQWIDTTETSLKLTIDQGKLVCYRRISDEVQTFVFGHTSLYDSIINTIEKLIKEGYFNKEYLEE